MSDPILGIHMNLHAAPDLAEIMKADTYDAKVNRNVNLTGAPDIILGSGQKALNPNPDSDNIQP